MYVLTIYSHFFLNSFTLHTAHLYCVRMMESSIDMEIYIFSLPKDNIARLNKQTNTTKK